MDLPLPDRPEALWESFSSKLKSQIRRPQKAGYEARFGLEHRPAFYEVFARNMRALGTPVLPADLFESITVRLAAHVVFGVVSRGDGSGIVFDFDIRRDGSGQGGE